MMLSGGRDEKGERHSLTPTEFRAVMSALRTGERRADKRLIVELQAVTGCRIGEALAFQWDDIKEERL